MLSSKQAVLSSKQAVLSSKQAILSSKQAVLSSKQATGHPSARVGPKRTVRNGRVHAISPEEILTGGGELNEGWRALKEARGLESASRVATSNESGAVPAAALA